jgi:hypothetical protein
MKITVLGLLVALGTVLLVVYAIKVQQQKNIGSERPQQEN